MSVLTDPVTRAAWLAETRYECLRALRRPAYFMPVIVLPAAFFLAFGVGMAKQNGGANATLQLMIGYSLFGMLGACIMGLAASVATEREQGLLLLKRALPMPPGAYLGAKLATALAIGGAVNLLLAVLGATAGHVSLPFWQWPALIGTALLGGLPFAALGLYLGSRTSAAAAPGFANALFLPMSFLGGLWIPLHILPPAFQIVAQFLPSWHLMQLSLAVIGRAEAGSKLFHVAVLVSFAALFFMLARRRLDPDAQAGEHTIPAPAPSD